jgi:hypothetical protein
MIFAHVPQCCELVHSKGDLQVSIYAVPMNHFMARRVKLVGAFSLPVGG